MHWQSQQDPWHLSEWEPLGTQLGDMSRYGFLGSLGLLMEEGVGGGLLKWEVGRRGESYCNSLGERWW